MAISRRKVFLDTSIQVDRALGSARRREAVAQALAGRWVGTSSYVWMEFRRSVLQAYAYIQTVVRTMQREGPPDLDWGELADRLASGGAIQFSGRALARVMRIYGAAVRACPAPLVPATLLLDHLDAYASTLMPARFFAGIDEYFTGTACDLVKSGAEIGDYVHSRLSCNGRTAQCQLVAFLQSHIEELRAVEAAWASTPPEQVDAEALAALRKVLENPQAALGERTCWRLGDLIIALEAPEDAAIYTTDGHFKVLCEALGKELFPDSVS